ncbi:hypothetical protein [Gloeobacter morelensis]|uniref:hypothetical protein n=1 Tax=Gloeobacter morelensis TaxID=2907343 RepID=UPI001E4E3BC9|nr:hypothetical protein [Gloeobacter morelensis]UFP97265.1 hypothetical protein ISF26_24395 [Gloeobacter morelensis MG652769]
MDKHDGADTPGREQPLAVHLLAIEPCERPGSFWVLLGIAGGTCRCLVTVGQPDRHGLVVINGDRDFERTFLTGPHISAAACRLVAQLAAGRTVDLPVCLRREHCGSL